MLELGIAQLAPVERRNYTEFRINAAVSEAAGAAVRGAAFGAVEVAAGMYARAFAAAEVDPPGARTAALTPLLLASMARRLVTGGEWFARHRGRRRARRATRGVELGRARRAGPGRLALHRHNVRAIVEHNRNHTRRGSRACALCNAAGRALARAPAAVVRGGFARAGCGARAAARRGGGRTRGPVDRAAARRGRRRGRGRGRSARGAKARDLGAGRPAGACRDSARADGARARPRRPRRTGNRGGWAPIRPRRWALLRSAVEACVLGVLGIPASGLADASADGTAQRESLPPMATWQRATAGAPCGA